MKIAIDGVIFQLQSGNPLGISRIWKELLPELIKISPDIEFILYERHGYPFPFRASVERRALPLYSWIRNTVENIEADWFISTYYTVAPNVKNLLYIYDMIPEALQWTGVEWDAKAHALRSAERFIAMSNSTAFDLLATLPIEDEDRLAGVVPGGVSKFFFPSSVKEQAAFRGKYKLPNRPYVMLSGRRDLYKNGNTIFEALATMSTPPYVLLAGGETGIPQQYYNAANKLEVHYIPHMGDLDLRPAYSGAIALYYPSSMEGFGLPVLEAMACGCPVIVGPAPATREFATGVFLDNPHNIDDVKQSLYDVMVHREALIENGIRDAGNFSWMNSAVEFRKALLK